jgi:hypothetical protein
MTTIIRRKRVSRSEIGPYRRHELLTGKAIFAAYGYSGYCIRPDTDVSHFIDDEMKRDWLQNRDELLEFWRSGKDTCEFFTPDCRVWLSVNGHPNTLPWAAIQFDEPEPEPRRVRRPQPEQRPTP